MNIFSRIWTVIRAVSSYAWQFLAPLIKDVVAAEKTRLLSLVEQLVKDAEAKFIAPGSGQEKYDWVVSRVKELLPEFQKSGGLLLDNIIQAAVSKLKAQEAK